MVYFLKVVTPEEIVFEGEVNALIAPGALGYLGILTDHAPLITTLQPGILVITEAQQQKRYYQVSRGFLEVDHNEAAVLVETIETTAPVDLGHGV